MDLHQAVPQAIGANVVTDFFADISPSFLIVLDSEQRFIYANRRMIEFLGKKSFDEISGQKFGMATLCENAGLGPDGCGNSKTCQSCGLHSAIRDSRNGDLVIRDFSIVDTQGRAAVFRGRVRSMEFDGKPVTALSMLDISGEKRRQNLETVFFHDLLNAATGMMGLLEIVENSFEADKESESLLRTARQCAEYIADEISFSRNLSRAESHELALTPESLPINLVLEKAAGFFSSRIENGTARIEIEKLENDRTIVTDRSLLVRILVNLIKNAIEAAPKGSVVRVNALEGAWNVLFSVHNEGVVPPFARDQIFRRSFSTKGPGRGLGTYSVQLFAEQYLKGRVWFTSSESEGTTFFVEIPNARS